MRIQHNIPAMSSYRNYTNNVSALSKNLERLSSGYKINRAGDDAAGLAISEKMRAQISGLEQAQNNAKSGINLVQTAEGALTEVHDMLNRMVTLAEQSANGTYDNDVDRVQLQKEVNQLRDEINRIADSSNFNGINLLDGSMSSTGVAATSNTFKDLPAVGDVLGTNTVLHKEAGASIDDTAFSIDLHNLEITGSVGDTFTIKIGDTELTGTLVGTAANATDIANALGAGDTSKVTFAVGGATYSQTAVTIGDGTFSVEASGTRVTFTQTDTAKVNPDMKVTITGSAGAGGSQGANGTKAVYASGTVTAVSISAPTNKLEIGGTSITVASTDDVAAVKGKLDTALGANWTFAVSGGDIIATNKNTGTNTLANATEVTPGAASATATASFTIASAESASASFGGLTNVNLGTSTTGTFTVSGTEFSWTATAATSGDVTITCTATTAGSDANDVEISYGTGGATVAAAGGADAAAAVYKYENVAQKVATATTSGGQMAIGGVTYTVTGTNVGDQLDDWVSQYNADAGNTEWTVAKNDTGDGIIYTAKTAGAVGGSVTGVPTTAPAGATEQTAGEDPEGGGGGTGSKVDGDYNVSTTVISSKTDGAGERLASTYFTLTEDMVSQGNSIKIGDDTYTFKTDSNGTGNIDVSDLKAGEPDYMTKVAERLTKAAENNSCYTVGHDGSRITVTENEANGSSFVGKLNTLEGIKESLGYSTVGKDGKALTLQIGDTSDSFNKMSVDIKDMHAAAMGIGDIDISTQEGASAAMKKIKDAINYVSDVRGDLGATQNRLDHTINNLSVMQENIQDAESTIRDVDVAKEMMEYTKNSILVQSAQAMLAQANQLPQGVLQLLG